ncbi:MAG: hypothetical protein LBJ19_02615 [Holosporaceae bacterium]|jgi:hypothetical protein|nr:hypothetical protein [Holosporaceae bacterium]
MVRELANFRINSVLKFMSISVGSKRKQQTETAAVNFLIGSPLIQCLLLAMALVFAQQACTTSANAADVQEKLPHLYEAFRKYGSKPNQPKMHEFLLQHFKTSELFEALLPWVSHNLDEIEKVSTDAVKTDCFSAINKARKSLEILYTVIKKNKRADVNQLQELVKATKQLCDDYNNAATLFMNHVLSDMQFEQEIMITHRNMNAFICQVFAQIFEKIKDNVLMTSQLLNEINNIIAKLKNTDGEKKYSATLKPPVLPVIGEPSDRIKNEPTPESSDDETLQKKDAQINKTGNEGK